MSSHILGIDLGTVNSCVAVVQNGRPVVLRDEAQVTIPSCLAFHKGKEIVGRPALRQAITDPRNTIAAVKRLMGHAWESSEVQSARSRMPYEIQPSPIGGVLIRVADRELTPVQVSARILQKVREVAERALSESVERAVISVPAHFTDVQRKATKLAAEYAGLEVVRLINEPTAAAFAYGYRRGEDLSLAVYDLGGGTFDISIMTARGDLFEVEATDGDSYLGGEDFDHAIANWLDLEFQAEYGEPLARDESSRMRLKDAAERAKIELSERPESTIELAYAAQLADGSSPHFARTLTREKLDELARPLIDRTLEICARCLSEAGLRSDDVREVLLVGGQSRMPAVREAVERFFGRPTRRDLNPDEVVAIGAALYGYSLEAENMRGEAQDAAEEAFAVARREADVARKVVVSVESLRAEPAAPAALANRLEQLLREAEAELPSPLAPRNNEDLPARMAELQSELENISKEADAAIDGAAAELGDRAVRDNDDSRVLGDAAEWINHRLESAREASRRAETHLEEARQHAAARRVNLIDVTSHALGIAAAEDHFSILIPKNASVPVEAEQTFTTHQDGQTEVEIRVAQGPARHASANQQLGSFVLEGVPPARRMEPRILVRFRIDEDGILSVSARDQRTGAEQGIRVEDPLGLQSKQTKGTAEST